jgi:tetratricopeptide (TPR) repeat protein
VAIILYNIATIHLEIGNDDEAMVYYRETLRVERAALGHTHKDVVLTMQHVGQVHQQRGELCNALTYFHDALEIQKNCNTGENSATPPDYAAIAQTLNHIGNVYLQRGNAKELVLAFSDCLRFLRRAGKSDDELQVSGFNFYGLSKMHPECAPVA